ncbi:MAG: hypothetical protein Kow0079_17490 [Vicingaceae bacterium]
MFEYKGVIIDKEQQQFKKYQKILFLKMGDWEKYSTPKFIAITKVKFTKTMPSNKLMGNEACTTDISEYKCCVFICSTTTKKSMVFKGKYNDAFDLAEKISAYLNVEIVNYVKQ